MFARQGLKSRGRPTAGLSSLACAGFSLIFVDNKFLAMQESLFWMDLFPVFMVLVDAGCV